MSASVSVGVTHTVSCGLLEIVTAGLGFGYEAVLVGCGIAFVSAVIYIQLLCTW